MADEIILKIRAEGVDQVMKEIKKTGAVVEDTGKKSDKAADRITKNNKKLTNSFKTLGLAVAAAFSIRAISRFATESVKLADVQLKAETKLLTALKGRTDVQKRLIKQAQELQTQTLFGDEATINAQALLASLGLNEDAITRLIPLVQDLAVKSGTDLGTAADLVAKSVGSSTNALSRYGVQIEGAVGSSERLESAIESLNEQVGGQAAAAAAVGTGRIEQLQNIIGDVREEIGKLILRGIGPLVEKIQPVVIAIGEWITAQSEVATRSKAVQSALEFVRNGFEQMRTILTTVGEGFAAIGRLIGSIARLFGFAKSEGDLFRRVLFGLQKAIFAVQNVLLRVVEATTRFVDGITKAVNKINDFGKAAKRWLGIGKKQAETSEDLADATGDAADAMGDASGATQDLTDDIKDLDNATTGAAGSISYLQAKIKDLKDEMVLLDPDDAKFFELVMEAAALEQQLEAVTTKVKAYSEALKELEGADPIDDFEPEDIEIPLKLKEDIQIDEPEIDLRIDTSDVERDTDKFYKDLTAKQEEAAKQAEMIEAKRQELVNESLEAGFDIFSDIMDRRIQIVQQEAEAGVITEEEAQRKIAEIRRKQAIADKLQALFGVTINTARGITSALALFPPNLVLAGIVGAIGAVQAATIAAQPIPQFAEGTKGRKKAPRGWAWVGEEGPELMQMRGGEKIVTAQDSEQLIKLLSGYGIPVQFKSTHEQLYKPMSGIAELKKSSTGINWNPLLMSNEKSRHYSGRKLDRIYEELHKLNGNFGRRMTRA